MRRSLVLLLVAVLAGCGGPRDAAPTTSSDPGAPAAPAKVSCQPFGYEPVLITFAYQTGPTTAQGAEQTAVGMLRACASTPDESGVFATITDLTSSVKAGMGGPKSPNAGQSVWEVQIDTLESIKGGDGYPAHYWIEVNQATGIPTLIALRLTTRQQLTEAAASVGSRSLRLRPRAREQVAEGGDFEPGAGTLGRRRAPAR